MMNVKFVNAIALLGIFMCISVVVESHTKRDCNCPGPTRQYKDLGCTPIFKNPDDCCPLRYDCSILRFLGEEQCLLGGRIYNDGEYLELGLSDPCMSCRCNGGMLGPCLLSRCGQPEISDHCHHVDTRYECCGRESCPKEDGTFATCVVDGKTYIDGQDFIPASEPNKHCHCRPGYTGENFEPYCVDVDETMCNSAWVRQHRYGFEKPSFDCSPVYAEGEPLNATCSEHYRCPSKSDVHFVRTRLPGEITIEDPAMTCQFGNLTLQVGDSLNEIDEVRCTCDVPPLLTCTKRSRSVDFVE